MTSLGPDPSIWHYDGTSASRHHPRIEWTADDFSLVWEDGRSGPYRWSALAPLGVAGGQSRYGLHGTPGWRLGFEGPPPEAFAIHLPPAGRYGRWIDRFGLWRASALFAVLAVATVLIVLRAPGWIGPHVPVSWENHLGDLMVGDFGGNLCRTPASDAALARLTNKLANGTKVRQVAIANVPLVNAVTLPGGRILIFDELIKKAASPDELAGVLGHEIGHVRHRDTVTALLRQFGLSLVLSGFNGQVGGTVNGLLAMSYSREAESAADGYAIRALDHADISPVPTARFFKTLSDKSGGPATERTMSWMASHPVSADREARFEEAVIKGRVYRPALSAADWTAIRNACRDSKPAKPSNSVAL